MLMVNYLLLELSFVRTISYFDFSTVCFVNGYWFLFDDCWAILYWFSWFTGCASDTLLVGLFFSLLLVERVWFGNTLLVLFDLFCVCCGGFGCLVD